MKLEEKEILLFINEHKEYEMKYNRYDFGSKIEYNLCSSRLNMVLEITDSDDDFAILVDNACSFGSHVQVSTRIEKTNKSGQKLILKVEDDGPGLNENQIEKIFDRFYSERSEEQKKHHTGLGLSLVKSVSDYLEGEIVVGKSIDLGGASFSFICNS